MISLQGHEGPFFDVFRLFPSEIEVFRKNFHRLQILPVFFQSFALFTAWLNFILLNQALDQPPIFKGIFIGNPVR